MTSATEKLNTIGQNGKLQNQHLFIFQKDDLDSIEKQRLNIFTNPIKFALIGSSMVLLAVKLNIRKLIANPLINEQAMQKNTRYWKYATINALVLGTIGSMGVSLYKRQTSKILLYQKYEQNVALFVKWKMQKEVQNYLLRTQNQELKKIQ